MDWLYQQRPNWNVLFTQICLKYVTKSMCRVGVNMSTSALIIRHYSTFELSIKFPIILIFLRFFRYTGVNGYAWLRSVCSTNGATVRALYMTPLDTFCDYYISMLSATLLEHNSRHLVSPQLYSTVEFQSILISQLAVRFTIVLLLVKCCF